MCRLMAGTRLAAWVATVSAAALLAVRTPVFAEEVDWTAAQPAAVVMIEYAFEPDSLTFKKGAAYRLHLDNQGKKTHEFTAPAFFKAISMRDATVVNADLTEIVVQPGEQKDLYFVAQQPGSYKLICSDHDWAGMIGEITITP